MDDGQSHIASITDELVDEHGVSPKMVKTQKTKSGLVTDMVIQKVRERLRG